MTVATLPDMRCMTVDELAGLIGADDEAVCMAAIAEIDRRERAARARSARRMRDTEWADAAHAQYIEADADCRGNLLSRRGLAAGVTEWSLWSGPEHVAQAYASEELRNWWREHGGRITVTEWRNGQAADRKDEQETAQAQAGRTGQEEPVNFVAHAVERAAESAVRSAVQHAARPPAPPQRETVQDIYRRNLGALKANQALAPRTAGQAISGTITAPPARTVPDAPAMLRRVLEEVGLLLTEHVSLPGRSAAVTIALWTAHAAARDSERDLIWRASPRLILTSAENGSGKSTLLDLLAMLLQARAGRQVKVTPYGLAGILGKLHEPAFPDDAQAVFGATGEAAKELLGVLLGSYTRGGTWTTGKGKISAEPVYGPVALAGKDALITKQAAALADLLARSIIIRMERATRYMPEVDEDTEDRAAVLARALKAVMGALQPQLREAARELAAENRGRLVTDGDGGRTAQIWRPLLAVARVAGGPWVGAAEQAMAELAAASGDLMAAEDALAGLRGAVDGDGPSFWDEV